MLIKLASSREATDQCPEDKLKFISYTDSVSTAKPLRPVNIESNHRGWVMDAWDNLVEDPYKSPERRPNTHRQSDLNSNKNIRIKKTGNSVDRSEIKSKCYPSQSMKSGLWALQKQNSNQAKFQLHPRPPKCVETDNNESKQFSPFKVPLNSILYPVIKGGQHRNKNRRMDRFHSFVARTIRK